MFRIMIVDDEVIIATQLADLVKSMGYQVAGTAASGREAITTARKNQPDLVLMDIVMPGETDGIVAAEKIKSEMDVSTLFVTAYADKEFLDRVKPVGPAGYILKPFRGEQVRVAIEIALYRDQMEKKIHESEHNFRALAENAYNGILITLDDGTHVYANAQASNITGYPVDDLIGGSVKDLVHPRQFRKITQRFRRWLKKKPAPAHLESIFIQKSGETVFVEITGSRTQWLGQPAVMSVFRDITRRKQMESDLKIAHKDLEIQVKKRTKELDAKTRGLEEINSALKVLMKKRDEEKVQLEEKVLLNVKQIAMPYLEKLKKSGLNARQLALAEILEGNLGDIISPFSHTLSSKYFHLTPTEIFIANLVKQGKTTKEISSVLGLSTKTVESHRKNIRRKLGLTNRGANLRTHLLSLP